MIVLDSNIFFSALIKDSITRKLILDYPGKFLFPAYIFEEFEKHRDEILEKSVLEKEAFETLMGLILDKMIIIPDNVLVKHSKEAIEIAKDIDINDAVFIAAVLAYPGSVLWSNDKKLKKAGVKVISTEEMMR